MIGKTISHYKIIKKIGEGGMGVVYKAQDTKLKRTVALKFLTPQVMGSQEEKARFIREAQAAAALDHPSICTVHEIDEADSQTFIAMAYIDGPSLKERVQAGPLNLDEVLDIGSQVAAGVEAAHEKGIVHRDLKSANVLLTSRGQAKIMDFGLAKSTGQTAITKTGTTVGTPAYMSPEQTRGEQVDHRTDIWSFGVMLYEMITGQLPFKGEYEQAVVYSIMNEDPAPMTGLRTGVPIELERIVNKALEKKKEDRYQHVEEMLVDFRRLKRDTTAVMTKPIERKRPKITRIVFLGLAALLVSLIIISIFSTKLFKREPAKKIQPTHRQITFTGKVSYPSISPDGNFVAYVSTESAGEQKVLVQDLTGGEPLQVFKDVEIRDLRWSPDGSELLVSAYNDSLPGTYLLPRLGGTPRRFRYFTNISWSPDGSRFAGSFLPNRYIYFTNKSTRDTTSISLAGSFTFLYDIDWSPAGNMLLCLTWDQKKYTVWTITIDGTEQHKIVEDSAYLSCPRWSSKGDEIYYLRSHGQTRDLMKIQIAPATGRVKGPAQVLQAGLQAGAFFTLSSDNKRLLYTRQQSFSNLWLASYQNSADPKEIKTKQLTTGTSRIYSPSISPDGKRIAFGMPKGGQTNIYVMPIEGGEMNQLTFFDSHNYGPVWSPDGKEIAFGSYQSGTPEVWRVNSDGGRPHLFDKTELSGDAHILTWSPGPEILYQRPGNRNYHFLNPDTEEERPLVENDSVGWMFYPKYSPDGRNVAVYWSRPDGGKITSGLWMISLEDSSQVRLHPSSFIPIAWSTDRKWIYGSFWSAANIFSADISIIPVSGGEAKTFATLPFEDISGISMHPKSKMFVCSVVEGQSDVWLMENFDPEVK